MQVPEQAKQTHAMLALLRLCIVKNKWKNLSHVSLDFLFTLRYAIERNFFNTLLESSLRVLCWIYIVDCSVFMTLHGGKERSYANETRRTLIMLINISLLL